MDKARYTELCTTLKGTTLFPNTRTDAYFRHHSQTIHLLTTTGAEYDRLARSGFIGALKAHDETIMHEVTHWADLLGTLWGRHLLARIYSAIHVALRVNEPSIEYEYWRLIDLRDTDRRIGLPSYYRAIEPNPTPHSRSKTWGISFSCGQEFGPDGRVNTGRPIFFVRFLDRDTGAQIARQPLRVAALLETIAVWSEMATGLQRLDEMDPDEATVERTRWSEALHSRIYNHELTEYTAPAHMLAFHTRTNELFLTYRNAAALAHLVLNLPDSLFRRLRHDAALNVFGGNRLTAFKASRDRGYAFAVICRQAPRSRPEQSARDWLDQALAQVNLPNSSEVYRLARNDMSRGLSDRIAGPYDRTLDYLLDVGREQFDARVASETPALTPALVTSAKLKMPLMFDEDGAVFHFGALGVDNVLADPEDLLYRESDILRVTENFISACR